MHSTLHRPMVPCLSLLFQRQGSHIALTISSFSSSISPSHHIPLTIHAHSSQCWPPHQQQAFGYIHGLSPSDQRNSHSHEPSPRPPASHTPNHLPPPTPKQKSSTKRRNTSQPKQHAKPPAPPTLPPPPRATLPSTANSSPPCSASWRTAARPTSDSTCYGTYWTGTNRRN